MQLQTLIDLPAFPFDISHRDKTCLIGSCFAHNVGQKFIENKFDTLSNPFGVLYNPMSVCECLDTIISNSYDENQLIAHDGVWHSFAHHSTFSNVDKETCLAGINKSITEAHQHLKDSQYLFLTFGTAQVFEKDGKVVSNCHKLPAKAFARRRVGVDEIVARAKQTIDKLKVLNPEINLIFTVSPVRYAKDGMHENSLSKATLHLAIEQLCQESHCHYLPAYEIVMDELRDYRFFAEDMTHPNQLSIDYVWERMENAYMSAETRQLSKRAQKIVVASKHRAFNTNPEAHQQFLKNMHKKASDLQSQHPEIDLSPELKVFSNKD